LDQLLGPVTPQHVLGGRQFQAVGVVARAQSVQEVFQVVAFGEAGQLAAVVGADIDDAADAMALQQAEELARGLLGEA